MVIPQYKTVDYSQYAGRMGNIAQEAVGTIGSTVQSIIQERDINKSKEAIWKTLKQDMVSNGATDPELNSTRQTLYNIKNKDQLMQYMGAYSEGSQLYKTFISHYADKPDSINIVSQKTPRPIFGQKDYASVLGIYEPFINKALSTAASQSIQPYNKEQLQNITQPGLTPEQQASQIDVNKLMPPDVSAVSGAAGRYSVPPEQLPEYKQAQGRLIGQQDFTTPESRVEARQNLAAQGIYTSKEAIEGSSTDIYKTQQSQLKQEQLDFAKQKQDDLNNYRKEQLKNAKLKLHEFFKLGNNNNRKDYLKDVNSSMSNINTQINTLTSQLNAISKAIGNIEKQKFYNEGLSDNEKSILSLFKKDNTPYDINTLIDIKSMLQDQISSAERDANEIQPIAREIRNKTFQEMARDLNINIKENKIAPQNVQPSTDIKTTKKNNKYSNLKVTN